jgi:N-acetylglucosaminyldiphosphoundecaprenol N-acetyl-beta-D-mannosaminyltransferase
LSTRPVILGVPFDSVTQDEALQRLLSMLHGSAQHHVMTPNNEMLVEGTKNPAFLKVMQSTALNLPDSTGVVWAARRQGTPLKERVPGVDTVLSLCGALSSDQTMFLLGAAPGVAQQAALYLSALFPKLKIVGTFAGSPRDEDAPGIIQEINQSGAKILLVAYGAPKQDLWIHTHLKDLPSIKLAMGVGGTFDFFAGVRKRAPLMLRKAGLEWLWRLILEPTRIKRIFTAVVTFPWLVLTRP